MNDWSRALSQSSHGVAADGPERGGSSSSALLHEEPLIFERDSPGRSGVDLLDPPAVTDRLGGLRRRAPVGLPGLSEPEVVRHYTRLSQKNYAIDLGLYPLGSCTMKHNPRLNERMARLPGFADIHPAQPVSTVQGALELINTLAHWLLTLTRMEAVALSPAAGAHGELCGLMAIRAALDARGETRGRMLSAESAHGTNPASAAACGFTVEPVKSNARGRLDLAALDAALGPDVAGIMVTNPNTCGLFEDEFVEIARRVHDHGGYVYCDGANFNAIVGRVLPGELGVDAMHINLHKTFSTPHGGGGPGSGPVVFSKKLAEFAPLPRILRDGEGYRLAETADESGGQPLGRLRAFHGQMGMFVRAVAYMMSHGADGLRQVSSDAVLNANYLLALLKDDLPPPFDGPCMHEVLFDDRALGEGATTLDIAKALIDEGFHPMTIYFPLVVHGAMLIEPTETESKTTLDRFAATLRMLVRHAREGDPSLKAAPLRAPRRRFDENLAARKPVLRWKKPA